MHAGVDKRSVDTWMHPALFHMQYSTGAPPDMFDAGGQNWGFPTYNWEEMAKDSYQWWRRRLTTLSECALAPQFPWLPRASACTSACFGTAHVLRSQLGFHPELWVLEGIMLASSGHRTCLSLAP